MYKSTICAGLLSLSLSTANAQQTDGILLDNIAKGVSYSAIDERSTDDVKTAVKLPSTLAKSLPFSKKISYEIAVTNSRKRRGMLTAFTSGTEFFSTHFRGNRLHGQWRSLYNNGALLDSGSFANNMPDGEWRSWYVNGKLRSIRTYSATKWYSVRSEVTRGNTKISFYSFSKFASWRNNLFENITSTKSSFATLATSSETYDPPFSYCFHHGLYMNFYHNGMVKDSGYYKDGLRDGLWNEFFDNGQLNAAGAYYRGEKDSGWKYYNRKGKLIMLSQYKHGRLIRSKRY